MKTKTSITYPAFALLAFICFAVAPQAQAACQDACLTNNNTVQGDTALIGNTTGTDDTGVGFHALLNNTTGVGNTANGSQALQSNTVGNFNTATGYQALLSNTFVAGNNTADGAFVLSSNTDGDGNTASGYGALYLNTTGSNNTANGVDALTSNSGGSNNTAIGYFALYNSTGSNNAALGYHAGFNLTTGSNNIDVGAFGVAGESNTIRIGKQGLQNSAFVQGIYGKTVANGVGVIVGSNGLLGTMVSSVRFKDAVKAMDKASEGILSLQPVTFRYKHELDPEGVPQFGLVAEAVEKVNPDLVARDQEGKPYTVRYDAVNAMLLNEFLKEHRTVQEQKVIVAQLKQDFQSRLAEQQKQIEALTAGLEKVGAQLELRKPALQTVLNKP